MRLTRSEPDSVRMEYDLTLRCDDVAVPKGAKREQAGGKSRTLRGSCELIEVDQSTPAEVNLELMVPFARYWPRRPQDGSRLILE